MVNSIMKNTSRNDFFREKKPRAIRCLVLESNKVLDTSRVESIFSVCLQCVRFWRLYLRTTSIMLTVQNRNPAQNCTTTSDTRKNDHLRSYDELCRACPWLTSELECRQSSFGNKLKKKNHTYSLYYEGRIGLWLAGRGRRLRVGTDMWWLTAVSARLFKDVTTKHDTTPLH